MNEAEIFGSDLAVRALWIFICLGASAFFSGSETAITSVGDIRLRHLLESKSGVSAKSIEFWLEKPTLVLSTILVGNNLFNILASALMTDLMLEVFQDNAVAYATGIMTMLVLLFGEVTPKSSAKVLSMKIVVPCLIIVLLCYMLLFPIVWIFSYSSEFIMKKLNITGAPGPSISEKELDYYIRMSAEESDINKRKKEMLTGLLELKETKVQDVMIPRPEMKTILAHQSVEELKEIVRQTGFSRIPVLSESEDEVIGMIHLKDLLGVEDSEKVYSIMKAAAFVHENKRLEGLFEEMRLNRFHLSIVLDEYGHTVGLVTLEDLIEEIMGEIRDEHDDEEDEVIKTGENKWDIDGLMHFEDFEEKFEVKLPHDEQEVTYTTIAGFIFSHLGRLPDVGDKVTVGKYTIEVKEVENRRICSLLVRMNKI